MTPPAAVDRRSWPGAGPAIAAAVLVSLAAAGCRDCGGAGDVTGTGKSEVEVPGERPPACSPGTLRGLGPHVWEAVYDRRGDREGIAPSRVATLRLVWAELDNYEFIEYGEAGGLRLEEIRLDRSIYRRNSAAAKYSVVPGTPGDSIILLRTLTEWDRAIGPFGDQVAWERVQDSTVEGRPVHVFRMSLAPPVAPEGPQAMDLDAAANRSGMAVMPTSLSGLVYVDIETGSRLLAEVEGRYVPRAVRGAPDPTDEVLVTYRESRSPTQLPPTISAPPEDRVQDRTRPGIPPAAGHSGSLDRPAPR